MTFSCDVFPVFSERRFDSPVIRFRMIKSPLVAIEQIPKWDEDIYITHILLLNLILSTRSVCLIYYLQMHLFLISDIF